MNNSGWRGGGSSRDENKWGKLHVTKVGTIMENIIIISEWSTSKVTSTQNTIISKVLADKKIRMTWKYINNLHHGSRSMDKTKVVNEKFLGPAT